MSCSPWWSGNINYNNGYCPNTQHFESAAGGHGEAAAGGKQGTGVHCQAGGKTGNALKSGYLCCSIFVE